MSYVELDFVKRVLRDDYLVYPENMDDYDSFAKAEINARLAGTYLVPFDDIAIYPTGVPPLIKWIAAYLIGYKLFDERTSLEGLDNPKGLEWWNMAQMWLLGLSGGDYILSDPLGVPVISIGSITAPRFYPSGYKNKANSDENVPYFTRDQAGKW